MRTPFERFEKSLTRDNLWIYILTLLKKESLYPYQVNKKVEEKFGFNPGSMTAYVVINKLKSGGYVVAEKTAKDKGPKKTYYKITDKGNKELEKAKRFHKKIARKMS